jgi:hypothetical protein
LQENTLFVMLGSMELFPVHRALWSIISVCLFATAGLEQVIVAYIAKQAALPKRAVFVVATRGMVLGFGVALGLVCATLVVCKPWMLTADAALQTDVSRVGPFVGCAVVAVWADAWAATALFVQKRFWYLACSYIVAVFVLLVLFFFNLFRLMLFRPVVLGFPGVWSWILIFFLVRILWIAVGSAKWGRGGIRPLKTHP